MIKIRKIYRKDTKAFMKPCVKKCYSLYNIPFIPEKVAYLQYLKTLISVKEYV